jgi:hypothetical protein
MRRSADQDTGDMLYRLYTQSKLWLNRLLDRVIDVADMFLMDAYRLPGRGAQAVARRMAQFVGDVCWLMRDFPRLSAYRLVGAHWTVIFVGGSHGLSEIVHLLFREEQIEPQAIGRVVMWRLSAHTQQWLADGADLVICELSRRHPRPSQAAIHFVVPTWVQQILTLPNSLESLTSGVRLKNVRHKLNRAERSGFDFRFSRSKPDFDHFYYHMYVPTIKARHGSLALVTPYLDLWRRWFSRGGLVLVTQHERPVAGLLCYIANGVCFGVESGVLEADPTLFQQEIQTMIRWYAIAWGHAQGARTYDLGGSHAWRANGPFVSKRRWGAHVARRKRTHSAWTFLAEKLSPALRDHINRLGFITEVDARFYGVWLNDCTAPAPKTDLQSKLAEALEQGLSGLVTVSPHVTQVISPATHAGSALNHVSITGS